MNTRILVAEDSSTIQKVVGISLSELNCPIEYVVDEESLYKKLRQGGFSLVLVDFKLSSEKNGVEFLKSIRVRDDQTPIIALLSTFDELEEDVMRELSIQGKITKPFDSSKLLTLCEEVLSGESAVDFQSIRLEEKDSNEDLDEWSLSIPSVIGQNSAEDELGDIPGVIESPEFKRSTSKLVSIEDLAPEEDEFPQEDDEENESFSFDSDSVSLAEEIHRQEDPDSFWTSDDSSDYKEEISGFDDDQYSEEVQFDDSPDEHAPSKERAEIDQDLIVERVVSELKEELLDRIELILREECQREVQKTAWEVIPELAEELIKKEIRSISEHVKSLNN